MKVKSINSFMGEIPMEQFVGSNFAAHPLGKLLIALTEETGWSGEYEVCGYWDEKPLLKIHHPAFLPERPLMIAEDSGIVSVRGVEDAIRKHFRDSEKSLVPEICRLQELKSELPRALDRIMVDKAKAAIIAVFPEAVDARHYSDLSDGSFNCFVVKKGGTEHLFVARKINHEFTSGIAQLDVSIPEWWQMDYRQRHDLFWKSLARAFAVHELEISEEQLHFGLVAADLETWTSGPHIVERVLFEIPNGPLVDVKFGPDYLPANVTLVPKPYGT